MSFFKRQDSPEFSGTQQGSGSTARIACTQCGANNYVGGTHCWQCGKPLGKRGGPEPPLAISFPAPGSTTDYYSKPQQTYQPPVPSVADQRPIAQEPIVIPRATADPDLAPKVAAAMGLIFPYVGLPAGMIFLMLDDERKVKLGWIMIGWSVVGTVFSLIIGLLTIAPVMGVLKDFAPHSLGQNPLSSGDLGGDNFLWPRF